MEMASFTTCKVQVTRNVDLEKLYAARRGAKIRMRRTTIAISSVDFNKRNPLLNGILCKAPFKRRRSVHSSAPTTSRAASSDSINGNILTNENHRSSKENNSQKDVIENGSPDEKVTSTTENCRPSYDRENNSTIDAVSEANQSGLSSEITVAESVGEIVGASKENDLPKGVASSPPNKSRHHISRKSSVAKRVLLPLPPLVEIGNSENPTNQISVIDEKIPDGLNLPQPLQPVTEETKKKRKLPDLIPIADVKLYSKFPGDVVEKRSKTSQFILDALDKMEANKSQSDQTVPIANITHEFDDSEEHFGTLRYSDSECSESSEEK